MKFKKENESLSIVDNDLGIDVVVSSNGIKGKGSRKFKEEINKGISEFLLSETSRDMEKVLNFNPSQNQEYTPVFSDYSQAALALNGIWNGTTQAIYDTISKNTLKTWVSEPVKYNPQLRKLSMYWYSLKGIINRTYEMYKNIHSLDSNLKIDNPLKEDIKESMLKIVKFDKGVNKKPLIRDIVFQTVADGTCIGYIHGMASKRYAQLLDLKYYLPKGMVDGVWQVEVDLIKLSTEYNDRINNFPYDYVLTSRELLPNSELLSQPPEVQEAFRKYQNSKSSKDRHYLLDIKKTFVIKIQCKQEERLGRPIATSAFESILHKELLRSAEVALIDRILNMILVIKMGTEGDKGYKPNKPEIKEMGANIRKALTEGNTEGLKLLGIPYWTDIQALKTDLGLFDKNKYESIDSDISTALGVEGLFGSDNSSFSSSQITMSIFMANVYAILEQIEENIFNYQYNLIVPESTITYKREFNRTMVLDNKTKLEYLNKLLDKGGSLKYVLDSIGVDFEEYYRTVKYEKDELDVNRVMIPFLTSFTHSGDADGNGRPVTNGDPDNGNNAPKPSAS